MEIILPLLSDFYLSYLTHLPKRDYYRKIAKLVIYFGLKAVILG